LSATGCLKKMGDTLMTDTQTAFVLVPREPTEEQLNAARDWSIKKYGMGVGNDGASGCYAAMLSAAPKPPESEIGPGWRRLGLLLWQLRTSSGCC